jgi:hypothetical protein
MPDNRRLGLQEKIEQGRIDLGRKGIQMEQGGTPGKTERRNGKTGPESYQPIAPHAQLIIRNGVDKINE